MLKSLAMIAIRRVTFLLFASFFAVAQTISIGVKAGVPLTQAFDAHTNPQMPASIIAAGSVTFIGDLWSATQRTLPYAVGPAFGVRVRGPLWVTSEALYTRADYYQRWLSHTPSSGVHDTDQKHAVSRWEFPILLEYRVAARAALHPFVTAGISIQYSRNYRGGGLIFGQGPSGPAYFTTFSGGFGPSTRSTATGPTVGAGFSFDNRRVRPSITLRYTRWANQPSPSPALQGAPNQVQMIAGLMF